jgi:hypothetical protein
MTISQRLHAQVALVALLVAALAVTGWMLAPAKALTWLIGSAAMACIWLVVAIVGRVRPFADQSAAERGLFTVSAIAGGLILAAALGKTLAAALGYDGGETLDRAIGVGTGVVLLVVGNAVPKTLGPLTANRCTPEQTQALQRFSGWTFAVSGLAYAAAWLFAPIDVARDWAVFIVAAGLAIAVVRHALALLTPARMS